MKTKREIAIKLTDKNRKKVQGILEMFGEKPHNLVAFRNNYLYFDELGFYDTAQYKDGAFTRGKDYIKPRELLIILAAEKLRVNDVIMLTTGDACIIKNETILNKTIRHNLFKRYATQEEIDLLKGKEELTKDDYKDLAWYKNKGTNSLIFIDKSKTETVGILGNNDFEFIFNLEWFNLFKENGFHIKHKWQEAAIQEVESALIKEAKRRGFDGDFNYCKVYNKLWNNHNIILQNGQWATIIEDDKFAELKEAHKNGAVIQFRAKGETEWVDIRGCEPTFSLHPEYRIKPDEKPKVGDVVKFSHDDEFCVKILTLDDINDVDLLESIEITVITQQEVIDLLFKDKTHE